MHRQPSPEPSRPAHAGARGRSVAKAAGWVGAFIALVLVGSGGTGIVGASVGTWAGAIPLPVAGGDAAHASANPLPSGSSPPPAELLDAGAPVDADSPRAPPNEAGPPAVADARVILNLATEADLQRLPGIGPTKARAILALRERLGKFRRVEELLKVRGIGRRTLARLRPHIAVDPP
jgi:competence protein ComEA